MSGIFVVEGRSNAANYGEEMRANRTGQVAAFNGSSRLLARDPMPGANGNKGSFMPLFGDEMQERFPVPIGIVARHPERAQMASVQCPSTNRPR